MFPPTKLLQVPLDINSSFNIRNICYNTTEKLPKLNRYGHELEVEYVKDSTSMLEL